jgi:hypothetical protein
MALRFVLSFHYTFASGPKIHYLCIGKGSAQAFPFFQPPCHGKTIRPKGPCERAFFTFSLGPNDIPSVALLQVRLGLMRTECRFSGFPETFFAHIRLRVSKCHVVYFHVLNKFPAI